MNPMNAGHQMRFGQGRVFTCNFPWTREKDGQEQFSTHPHSLKRCSLLEDPNTATGTRDVPDTGDYIVIYTKSPENCQVAEVMKCHGSTWSLYEADVKYVSDDHWLTQLSRQSLPKLQSLTEESQGTLPRLQETAPQTPQEPPRVRHFLGLPLPKWLFG